MRSTAVEAAVRRALAAEGLCSPASTVVAALSGGPDSVALLSALVALRGRYGMRVVAAHLDHRLREESAADAAFCAALCQELDVPLRTSSVDVRARARRQGGGLEQAARRARYSFLRRVRSAVSADAIAVAHTRDDQAETVLLRLLRGAGRTGLGAMKPRARGLVRPLLGVTRQAVLAHLRRRGLAWREDASNADTRLARNRVRHELIPYLEARFNPGVRATLARAAVALAAEQELLETMAGELFARAGRPDGAGLALERAALAAAPEALARLALRRALRASGG
ncbi:MAG TPA: tRNA lysidine(34) synthetase TilS, partial [Vicinamibacteria bacterium]|nr:tRNA lysidine(34) synthetase TilS [Vicinamibacteria bacterium]